MLLQSAWHHALLSWPIKSSQLPYAVAKKLQQREVKQLVKDAHLWNQNCNAAGLIQNHHTVSQVNWTTQKNYVIIVQDWLLVVGVYVLQKDWSRMLCFLLSPPHLSQ